MDYQEEMEYKAKMHDHWQNKAFDLLCENVALKSELSLFEYRDKMLNEHINGYRKDIEKLKEEIEELQYNLECVKEYKNEDVNSEGEEF